MRIEANLSSNPREWEDVLEGFVRASMRQILSGRVPPFEAAPHVRWKREPRGRERWQTARETVQLGSGDCEDLAVFYVASARLRGKKARVVIRHSGIGKWHALALVGRRIVDPSRMRGMGARK